MNNKTYWLIGIFFLAFANNLSGQIDSTASSSDFLKNYIPPNYKYHSFFVNPSFRESVVRSTTLDRNRFSTSMFGNYQFAMQKDLSDTEFSVFFNSDFVSDERNEVRSDNDNTFSHVVRVQANRFFYLSGKAFVSVGSEINSNSRLRYLAENLNSHEHNISIPISIGFGRPYQVSDAWWAQTLFHDLECYGIAADRSQTKEVADLVSTIRNRRFLDNRLGRIENRTNLLNYLNDNNIVNLTALSSSVIHDTYRFEFYYTRLSGFKIQGGIIPKAGTFKRGDGEEYFSNSGLALSPFFNFEFYLPISEDWQLDIENYVIFQDQEFAEQDVFQTNNTITLNWLPNLRTRSQAQLIHRGFDNGLDFNSQELGLNLTFQYYLSPAVTWTTSALFLKDWQELTGNKREVFEQVFSAGFSYRFI